MSFFESLKRFFTGTGQNGRSMETAPSDSGSSPDEPTVALISCEEASARLFEYLDGELEGVDEEEVRRHLDVCEECYPRVEFEKHFLEALRRSQDLEGGRVSESLRERVLEAVEQEERSD